MIVFPIAFFVLMISLTIIGNIMERKLWNKGKCPDCNKKWRYFDTDSQGGKGYTCDKCDRTIWISWPFIDKKTNNGE